MGKQEFICVECFSCKTFQVIIVSKKSKFQCKICNEKQSVRKIYAISDKAKDIRAVVQKMNENRDEIEERVEEIVQEQPKLKNIQTTQTSGKWKDFLEKEDEEDEDDPRYTTIDPSTISGKRKRKTEKEDFQLIFESSNKKRKETQNEGSMKDYLQIEPKIQKKIQREPIIQQTKTVQKNLKIKNQETAQNSKWGDYLPESSSDEE
eukprot:gene3996-7252_t